MRISTNSKKEFRPFDLIITIETVRELQTLIAFFNASVTEKTILANKNKPECIDFEITGSDVSKLSEVYHVLDSAYSKTI